ncbi:PQQ-binding-like beta-propeller repeat protein [Streptomyces sp. AJS327]|uniref:outer membrane protein assembly factor BamB family protein n=1 Tax=Streptomyces sp. AJS327 TaxID=2545265 RepID=UPI0015E01396|nr:PQQ-binding-like beta-propeller repeat protein [Streptomyces sp. AJS327]
MDASAGELWKKVAKDAPRRGQDTPGTWTVGDQLVKASMDTVIGYDAATGDEKWTVKLKGDVCAASRHTTSDDKVVVGYTGKSDDECPNVTVIDLAKGKQGWKKALPKSGGFAENYIGTGLTISGQTIGATWGSGNTLLRVKDGKEIKQPETKAGCGVDGYGGGKSLLKADHCLNGDVATSTVKELNPKTGKTRWTHKLPQGYQVNQVYSTSPIVLGIVDNDKKTGSIVALDGKGKKRSTLDPGKAKIQPKCGIGGITSNSLELCSGYAVSQDRMYLPTKMERGGEPGEGLSNEIHAFDLDSGKSTGKPITMKGRLVTPIGTRGSSLLMFGQPGYDSGGEVVSVSSGGKQKSLLKTPDSASSTQRVLTEGDLLYHQKRLFMASTRVQGGNGAYDTLILAFGPE